MYLIIYNVYTICIYLYIIKIERVAVVHLLCIYLFILLVSLLFGVSIGLMRLCRRFGDIGSPIKVYFLKPTCLLITANLSKKLSTPFSTKESMILSISESSIWLRSRTSMWSRRTIHTRGRSLHKKRYWRLYWIPIHFSEQIKKYTLIG